MPLINAYGPTECSDDVATHRLTTAPTPLATVPIGRPIANTRLYVLDAHLQPVPIGVAGELYVGGIGVGRGYLNDPEQTRRKASFATRFRTARARLYRTGDLARWRADGMLEFLGRIDHQVKIRGYRIELEEIEHVLMEHPDVRAARAGRGTTLAAKRDWLRILSPPPSRQPKGQRASRFPQDQLPGYMIPAGFSSWTAAVDGPRQGRSCRAGGDPPGAQHGGRGVRGATQSTEEVLADIWADLLKVEDIGVFRQLLRLGRPFAVGGPGAGPGRECFGVSSADRALFEAPTIEALARRIDAARETQSNEPPLEIARVEGDGPQPVSIMQDNVLTDREGVAWTAPVQSALRLSAAGAAEHPRA